MCLPFLSKNPSLVIGIIKESKALCHAQWGAITIVMVSSPVLGSAAKTSFERCIGTICGGWLGYAFAVALVGTGAAAWALPLLSMAVAFCAALLGVRLKLVYSAKLAALTFILGEPSAVLP